MKAGDRRSSSTRGTTFRAAALAIATVAASPAAAQDPTESFVIHEQPQFLRDVRFEDAGGEGLWLSDFQGRVVLLNLWATWCAPCRREMPTLDRLQARLGGPEFEVVALSLDRKGAPAVEAFFRDLGVRHLAIYVDRTARAASMLEATGLPTTLLIDRETMEIGRLAGPAEWDSPEMIALIERYVKRQGAADDSQTSTDQLEGKE
jgi:thiol-disulfide isomerase/thioredoxin